VDVAVFTNAVQVEHLFQVAADPAALVAALRRGVVTSIGPVCSEALEAHGVTPDLEASPPKLGPLVTLLAARGATLVAARHGGSRAPAGPPARPAAGAARRPSAAASARVSTRPSGHHA